MSKNITLNINNAKSTVETMQFKTASGQALRIPAQNKVNYQFIDDATGFGPENIMTKRVGDNLEIAFEGTDISDLTTDKSPVISGTTTAVPGSMVTVTVKDANGDVQEVTIPVDEEGKFAVRMPNPLAVGDYTASAVVVNSDNGQRAAVSDPGSVIEPLTLR